MNEKSRISRRTVGGVNWTLGVMIVSRNVSRLRVNYKPLIYSVT